MAQQSRLIAANPSAANSNAEKKWRNGQKEEKKTHAQATLE
jgi:hypothetical protein